MEKCYFVQQAKIEIAVSSWFITALCNMSEKALGASF